MNFFPTIQRSVKAGVIDLAWGQPDPSLLPVDEMRRAGEIALDEFGWEMLDYGAEAGAGPLLDFLRARIERTEGRTLAPDQIITTAGISDALDQICTFRTQPGDTVLIEAPTYHLAVKILRDHLLDIVPIPTDEEGLRVNDLQAILAELKHAGKHPKFLYTIPTFHNPTGVSLSEGRRRGLIKVAAQENLLLVEDDVYRELAYDEPAPPSLWSLAPDGVVLRMGSFAKSFAPGVRLGFLTGSKEFLSRMTGGGLRDSGGGVNHFTAMLLGAACRAGLYDSQIEKLRAAYRERRDVLAETVRAELPLAEFIKPGGGFFIWLYFPDNVDTQVLRAYAPEHGVDFVHGARFFVEGGGTNALRLAFSLYPPHELQEATKRLRRALDAAR